jgi:hypothetical protein
VELALVELATVELATVELAPVTVFDVDEPAAPEEGSFEGDSDEQPMSAPFVIVIAVSARVEKARRMDLILFLHLASHRLLWQEEALLPPELTGDALGRRRPKRS